MIVRIILVIKMKLSGKSLNVILAVVAIFSFTLGILITAKFDFTSALPAPLRGPSAASNDDSPPIQPDSKVLALQEAFVKVSEQVGKAVVHISTEKRIRYRYVDPFYDFLDDFFGGRGRPKEKIHEIPRSGLGTGMIVNADGHILTNYHVVREIIGDERAKIEVILPDKKDKYKARVTGYDKSRDLAVIKIESKEKLPFVKFGDSDKVRVGEWAIAIGNPFGYDNSVTVGIISAKRKLAPSGLPKNQEGGSSLKDLIQTDAAINPGNSGGPLVNIYGQVIGINMSIAVSEVAQNAGVGFAIPSNDAKEVLDKLIKGEKVTKSRPWLGVQLSEADPESLQELGIQKGALIYSVIEDSPAETAGLKASDIVISLNGKEISNPSDFLKLISEYKPGDKIQIKLIRRGKQKLISATLSSIDTQ